MTPSLLRRVRAGPAHDERGGCVESAAAPMVGFASLKTPYLAGGPPYKVRQASRFLTLQYGSERLVASITFREISPVCLAQGTYQGVTSLVADLAIPVAAAIIQSRIAISLGHGGPPEIAIDACLAAISSVNKMATLWWGPIRA